MKKPKPTIDECSICDNCKELEAVIEEVKEVCKNGAHMKIEGKTREQAQITEIWNICLMDNKAKQELQGG